MNAIAMIERCAKHQMYGTMMMTSHVVGWVPIYIRGLADNDYIDLNGIFMSLKVDIAKSNLEI